MSEVGPTAWEDDNFDIRFAFFGRTDMEIRLRVLEGRRTRLQERLARVQGELERTQAEVNRYAAELQRHGVESVEREVRWLSDLINAERGDEAPAPAPAPAPSPSRTTSDQLSTDQPADQQREGEPHGFGTSSNRGSRQLRHLPDPGRRVLQGRRPDRHRPRAHARHVRRLPRQRRGVRRRLRRRRQEGRQGPLRGHQRLREQHHQDLRRPDPRRRGPARPDPRRPRQVLPP